MGGYIDPNLIGMISQIGYVILFGLVSSFMFFFKPLQATIQRFWKKQDAASKTDSAKQNSSESL